MNDIKDELQNIILGDEQTGSGNQRTGSITIAFTPVRVVCQNTLNAALNNHVNCIKIRHTASATDKLKQAHKILGITNQLSVELEAVFNRWSGCG